MGQTESRSIAVLGGGVTGLAAAWRLTAMGRRVRLFEQSPRLGGAVRTELAGGWLVEAGPHSLAESAPEIGGLLREAGLHDERLEASPAARNRYLVRGGRLRPAPLSPPAFLRSPLFSLGAKLRVLAEFCFPRRIRAADLSLAAFARAHFGREIVDYGLQPFVSGVYAGDPEKLSARLAFPRLWEIERTHGSLLRGQIAAAKSRRARGEPAVPKIVSFRRGMQMLPAALAARLPPGAVTLNARADSIVRGAKWEVLWRDGEAAHRESFDAVVAALPGPALARLGVGAETESPLAGLDTIAHPPLSSLFLGFPREQVRHPLDGFGVLVPALENRALLGVIFCSTLFPGRAPEGHVALAVMIGGALRPELAAQPADRLWATVRGDLHDLLGVTGEPVFQRHAFWPRAIPQYHLGYERHLDAINACEARHPGLFIGGSVRDGISIPDCLRSGLKLAERAGAFA